jgi:inner membrane protein
MYYFTEMKDRYSIHPVHYVLVGVSISVFYLLLLSFSEIIGFGPSYIIASLMVIALLTLYTRSISPSTLLYKLVALLQTFIFGFVYILLSLESYSLVAGSVGVFVILAVLMYYASKIDWYNKGGVKKGEESQDGISNAGEGLE